MNTEHDNQNNPLLVIRNNYDTLTNTQKKIADLLLNHGDRVCFISLREFSAEVGVTAVTVIRFCKKLGYANYSSLKKALQYYMRSFMAPTRIIKTNEIQDIHLNSNVLFDQLVQNEQKLVKRSHEMLNPEKIIEALALIKGASKVYVAATGAALAVAQFMSTRLHYFNINTELLNYSWKTVNPSHLSLVQPEDVFIIFSFPNYGKQMVDLIECVKALGAQAIGITDKPTSPIANYADLVLLCDVQGKVLSSAMTPAMSLASILLSFLAVVNKEEIENNNNRLAFLRQYISNY